MLCLLVVKGTKYLSPLGVRDLYSSLRTLSYTASKQNITSILHFPFHAVLLIPQPQLSAGSKRPLKLTCRAVSFFLLPMALQRRQKPCYCWLEPARGRSLSTNSFADQRASFRQSIPSPTTRPFKVNISGSK